MKWKSKSKKWALTIPAVLIAASMLSVGALTALQSEMYLTDGGNFSLKENNTSPRTVFDTEKLGTSDVKESLDAPQSIEQSSLDSSEPPTPSVWGAELYEVGNITGNSGSTFGWNVSSGGDVNNDGYNDTVVGAPGEDTAYVFFGWDRIGGAMSTSDVNVTLTGPSNSNFSWDVAIIGDADGDGYDDVAVGAPDTTNGNVYIFLGSSLSVQSSISYSSADVTLSGEASGDKFGTSVSGAGNVNGDSYDDVVVGAPYADGDGTDRGKVYVYFGASTMDNNVGFTLTGEDNNGLFGFSVSDAGDIDGDNKDDFIIGEPGNDMAYIYKNGLLYKNAESETPDKGAVTNDYRWTQEQNDSYESIVEVSSGGLENMFYDGFESGGFTTGGWTLSTPAPVVSNENPYEGTYAAGGDVGLLGATTNTYSFEKIIDTTDYTSISIEYARAVEDAGAGSVTFVAEWYDGSTWTELETETDTNNVYSTTSWDLSSTTAENNADFTIRFKATFAGGAQSSANGFWVDMVYVNGTAPNTNKLEHKWAFTLEVGKGTTFEIDAYYAAEGAKFYYSTDGSGNVGDWTLMLTVTKTSDDDTYQTYTDSTLSSYSGTIYVGVADSDRSTGDSTLDTLYIDHMRFGIVKDLMPLEYDAGTKFGYSVAAAGNVNNDAYDDFIVGAPNSNSDAGAAFIFFGGATLDFTQEWLQTTYEDFNAGTTSSTQVRPLTDDIKLTKTGFTWTDTDAWDMSTDLGLYSAPALADLDNDGDMDMLVGEGDGPMNGYRNTGSATSPTWTSDSALVTGIADPGTYSVPAFADLDDDGDYDLMVGAGDGTMEAYENTGSASSPTWTLNSVWWDTATDPGTEAKPAFADLDGDGDYDMLIGLSTGVCIGYENTGSSTSPSWAANTAWDTPAVGTYVKPALTDLDYDGDYDVIIGSNDGISYAYENTGSTASPTWTANSNWDAPVVGSYATPEFGDLDGDGEVDLMIGEYDTAICNGYRNTPTFTTPGTFTSQSHDFGVPVDLRTIKWTESIEGGVTDITIETSSSTDGSSWSAWSSSVTDPSGSTITSPDARWIRWRATFTTSDTSKSPTLFDVTAIARPMPLLNLTGETSGDQFGFNVDSAGDIDGDGINDVVVGAPENDGSVSNGGAVYVFKGSGSLGGTVSASNADYGFYGKYSGEQIGRSVCQANDVSNDGYNDIIAGAPYNNTDYGAAYILSSAVTVFPASLSLSATGTDNVDVKLDWTAASGPVPAYFKVYRATTRWGFDFATPTYTVVGSVLTWTDTNAPQDTSTDYNSTHYYYIIRAESASGNIEKNWCALGIHRYDLWGNWSIVPWLSLETEDIDNVAFDGLVEYDGTNGDTYDYDKVERWSPSGEVWESFTTNLLDGDQDFLNMEPGYGYAVHTRTSQESCRWIYIEGGETNPTDNGIPESATLGAVSGLALQGTGTDSKDIQLTWNSVASATKYRIYRASTRWGFDFTNPVAVVDAPTTTWTDTSASDQSSSGYKYTTYYYIVRAAIGLTEEEKNWDVEGLHRYVLDQGWNLITWDMETTADITTTFTSSGLAAYDGSSGDYDKVYRWDPSTDSWKKFFAYDPWGVFTDEFTDFDSGYAYVLDIKTTVTFWYTESA